MHSSLTKARTGLFLASLLLLLGGCEVKVDFSGQGNYSGPGPSNDPSALTKTAWQLEPGTNDFQAALHRNGASSGSPLVLNFQNDNSGSVKIGENDEASSEEFDFQYSVDVAAGTITLTPRDGSASSAFHYRFSGSGELVLSSSDGSLTYSFSVYVPPVDNESDAEELVERPWILNGPIPQGANRDLQTLQFHADGTGRGGPLINYASMLPTPVNETADFHYTLNAGELTIRFDGAACLQANPPCMVDQPAPMVFTYHLTEGGDVPDSLRLTDVASGLQYNYSQAEPAYALPMGQGAN